MVLNFNEWLNEGRKKYLNPDLEIRRLRALGYEITRKRLKTWTLEVPRPSDPNHPINKFLRKADSDSNRIIKKVSSSSSTLFHFYSFKDREDFTKKIRAIEREIQFNDPKYKLISLSTNIDLVEISDETIHKIFKNVTGGWDSLDDRGGAEATDLLFEHYLTKNQELDLLVKDLNANNIWLLNRASDVSKSKVNAKFEVITIDVSNIDESEVRVIDEFKEMLVGSKTFFSWTSNDENTFYSYFFVGDPVSKKRERAQSGEKSEVDQYFTFLRKYLFTAPLHKHSTYQEIDLLDAKEYYKKVIGKDFVPTDDQEGQAYYSSILENLSYDEIWQKAKEWGFPVEDGVTAYNERVKSFRFYVVTCTFNNDHTYEKLCSKFEAEFDRVSSSLETYFRKEKTPPENRTIEYSFFEKEDSKFFSQKIGELTITKLGILSFDNFEMEAEITPEEAQKFYDIYFGRFGSPEEEEGSFATNKIL